MNLFTFIKSNVSIVTVVGEYATLRKAGIYLKAPCPFHSEKTPSFTVSPHKEIFYCFGCHAGGDVITFIAKAEHCTPLEAAKHLIDRYNLSVPESYASEIVQSPQKKRYFEVCQLIAQWCHEQLLKSPPALTYIKNRGFELGVIKRYEIGYFPGGLHAIKALLNDMNKHHILAEDLLEMNFLSRGKQVLFSPFEERIMFPIADHLGRVCGFGGRVWRPADARPKYYNSHENEFFSKGHLLFGLNTAKKEMQQRQKVLVVEGYTDALALAQHGYLHVVATLGTACTADHLKVLARYVQQVYLLYDGDKAGSQAVLRIAELCWQANLDLWVAVLPAGDDPASFLAQGKDIAPVIEQAQDIFGFFIAHTGQNYAQKPLAEKVAIARKILELIVRIEDPLKQDLLLAQAQHTLALPLESLRNEMYYIQNQQVPPPSIPIVVRSESDKAIRVREGDNLEKKIFYSIINNIELFTGQNQDFLCTYLPAPYKSVLQVLKDEKARNSQLSFTQFFPLLDESAQQIVSQVVLEYQEIVTSEVFEQLIIQLQRKHWKVIVNDIKLKLEHARLQGNEPEIHTLIECFIALKKQVLDNHKNAVGTYEENNQKK